MSRLETSAEPSMEEILASIRKIIAEEPPGSRGAPPAVRPSAPSTPASSPKRGFMTREAFIRSSAPAETQPSGPEPDPVKAGPDSKDETSPASSPLISHADHGPADKTDPSAKPDGQHGIAAANAGEIKDEVHAKIGAEPMSAAAVAPDHASVEENTEAPEPLSGDDSKSIEAQLADLLGDDLQALDGAQHDDPAAGDLDLDSSVIRNETSHPELRREDLTPGGKHINGASEPVDAGDPFAFNLGPSPFLSRSEETESQAHEETESPSAFEAIQESESKRSFDDEHRASSPSPNSYAPAPEPKLPAEASPIPPRPARASEPFGVPSVAATLGPHRTLEPLSASFRSSAFEQPAFDRRADRSLEETAPPVEPDRGSGVRAEFRGERLERILQPAVTEENRQDSAIEDAVADLLRPLLRTWLAENMPKIIERALRREMAERLLPGQKGPFD